MTIKNRLILPGVKGIMTILAILSLALSILGAMLYFNTIAVVRKHQ